MSTTSDSSRMEHARHLVAYGDTLFAQGATALRQACIALPAGDARLALDFKKLAYRAFESADCCYARGHAACGQREARRRRSIRAVVQVSIYAFDPLPIPGSDARADQSHQFKFRELSQRGRRAVRRHQVTGAVAMAVPESEMSRAILDAEGVWQDSVGHVVTNERRSAAERWGSFVRNASHYVAGWRADELLAQLPDILRSQGATIAKAFAAAQPA